MSDAIVAAFNADITSEEVLALIRSNDAALLDPTRIQNLAYLADAPDREQAVGSGVNEIKTLFGNFKSLLEITAVVERQIDVEYAKYFFVYTFKEQSSAEGIPTRRPKT
jgi:hypothetical protein